MTTGVINGWTAPRLDELNATVATLRDDMASIKPDVSEIKTTLATMADEEVKRLRAENVRLRSRPGRWLVASVPIAAVLLGEILSHVHIP